MPQKAGFSAFLSYGKFKLVLDLLPSFCVNPNLILGKVCS